MANVPNLSVVRDQGKPRKLGRYELEECLGAEGGRETYRARVRGLAGFDRIFAVKCLRRQAGPVTNRSDPFLVAAKRVGSVIDARVARVLDTDIIDGAAVVVTELIQGLDLDRFREWAQSSGELALGTDQAAERWQRFVAYIGGEIARALASMHALVPPFVHGGLSPRNVIVTSRGAVRVLDAGLAVAAQKGGDPGSQRAAAYAAPGAAGTDPMPPADVRALGAMLFELAVGEPPPPDAGSTARQLLEPAWPPMAELVGAMLSDERTSRPRARQVAETLAKYWSSVPEATIISELAALVRNFSTFVADAPAAGGGALSPSPDAAAVTPVLPSTSGFLPVAPPSPSAIASGSFLVASDAATRVSPDSGYASAIFRAVPADAARPPAAQPSKVGAAPPAPPALGVRAPTLQVPAATKPGTLGKAVMPTLPPAPKIEPPPMRRLVSEPPAAKVTSAPAPGAPPSSARTVVWSPGPAQALGIAPALLSRTLMAPPPAAAAPSPAAMPLGAASAAALAPSLEETIEPESMDETAEWGAQALAALGSQAGVAVVLAPVEGEQASFAPSGGEAPPPVSDPTIEEAFAFSPQQSMPDSWSSPPAPSQAGPPVLGEQALAAPARREMLEDELVEDETAPMLLSTQGEPQAQMEDAVPDSAVAGETAPEAELHAPASLEATAFMSEEEGGVPPEAEPDRIAAEIPAPAPPTRGPGTRNALRPKADLETGGLDDETWQPTRSRTKRVVVVVIAAAAVGAGAAALMLGPLGGKRNAPPAALSKARAPKASPAPVKAAPIEAVPAPSAALAESAPTEKASPTATQRKGTPSAKAPLTPPEGKAGSAAATRAEATTAGKKVPAPAPGKVAVAANAELALIPRLAGAAPQPAPTTGGGVRVRVESKPAGAHVWIQGQERGETPLSVSLKPGSARIVLVHPGYSTHQATLEVREGATLEATLKPVTPPMTGEARFRAECQTTGKLPIVVDGKETGILCPFTKMRVDPGVHTIGLLIPATGQVHQKEVTLRPGVRSVVFAD